MGRDDASQVFSKSIAGRLEITLTNDDGRFTDENIASPLHDQVNVQRTVGVTYQFGSNTYSLWWGYIDEIDPEQGPGGSDVVVLRAFGILSLLLDPTRVTTPLQQDVDIDDAVIAVLDQSGIGADQRGSISSVTRMPWWWTDDEEALQALQELEDTEGGFCREGGPNETGPAVLFEDANYRITGSRRQVSLTLTDDLSNTSGIPIAPPRLRRPTQDIVNIVQVPLRRFADQVTTPIVLWELRETFTLSAGDTVTFIARYPVPGSPSNHVAVHPWSDLDPGVDYSANDLPDGSGTDRTVDMGVSIVAKATTLTITVANTHATNDFVVTLLRARGIPLAQDEPAIVEERDQASIDLYKPRVYPAPSQFLGTVDAARSYATFTLRLLSTPRTRAEVSFDVTDYLEAGNSPPDMSDRVRLDLKGISRDMFVEGF